MSYLLPNAKKSITSACNPRQKYVSGSSKYIDEMEFWNFGCGLYNFDFQHFGNSEVH